MHRPPEELRLFSMLSWQKTKPFQIITAENSAILFSLYRRPPENSREKQKVHNLLRKRKTAACRKAGRREIGKRQPPFPFLNRLNPNLAANAKIRSQRSSKISFHKNRSIPKPLQPSPVGGCQRRILLNPEAPSRPDETLLPLPNFKRQPRCTDLFRLF